MVDGLMALSSVAKPNAVGAGMAVGGNAASTATGLSFGEMLGQVAGSAASAMQSGEAAAIQGIQGDLSPFKVVETVMSAQRTLQAALAFRDKAVAAFQEISRMAI